MAKRRKERRLYKLCCPQCGQYYSSDHATRGDATYAKDREACDDCGYVDVDGKELFFDVVQFLEVLPKKRKAMRRGK